MDRNLGVHGLSLAFATCLWVAMSLSLCGCQSATGEGALLGAGVGAVAGGVIGGAVGDGKGAALGAAAGGLVGAGVGGLIGRSIDQDKEEARAEEAGVNATVLDAQQRRKQAEQVNRTMRAEVDAHAKIVADLQSRKQQGTVTTDEVARERERLDFLVAKYQGEVNRIEREIAAQERLREHLLPKSADAAKPDQGLDALTAEVELLKAEKDKLARDLERLRALNLGLTT